MINLSIPQIPVPQMNGGNSFNMEFFMHLGSSDVFGNMNLKNFDLAQRHHYINQLLREILYDHSLEKEKFNGTFYTVDHLFYKIKNHTETVIYWMRKTADEYISIAYYVYCVYIAKRDVGRFLIDSIGSLLAKPKSGEENEIKSVLKTAFESHLEFLRRLNEVSNTFKHAFMHHEIMHLIGKDEPTVIELNTNKNDFTQPFKYNSYSLKKIVLDYSDFYETADKQIKQWRKEWEEESIKKSNLNT